MHISVTASVIFLRSSVKALRQGTGESMSMNGGNHMQHWQIILLQASYVENLNPALQPPELLSRAVTCNACGKLFVLQVLVVFDHDLNKIINYNFTNQNGGDVIGRGPGRMTD
jgi:hypothetical protein